MTRIFIVLSGLLLAAPLLLVALIIRLTSPGPVLFRQQRSGLNGRPFTMLKFRSMVTNAEQLKQELAALNYRNLDDVPEFAGRNTTTEFLAHTIYLRFVAAVRRGELGAGQAARVGVVERRIALRDKTNGAR